MDSPYLPKILWFFERRQLYNNGNLIKRKRNSISFFLSILDDKYILGTDSLIIRNFSLSDQGIYYCRAFITLKTNFLTKIYPILVQIQNQNSSSNISNSLAIENKYCPGFNQTIIINNTISYCNTDGYISNQTCPKDQIWNKDYSQCSVELSMWIYLE